MAKPSEELVIPTEDHFVWEDDNEWLPPVRDILAISTPAPTAAPEVSSSTLAAVCAELVTVGTAIQRLGRTLAPPPSVSALRAAVAQEIATNVGSSSSSSLGNKTAIQLSDDEMEEITTSILRSHKQPETAVAIENAPVETDAQEADHSSAADLSVSSKSDNAIEIDLIAPADVRRLKLDKKDPDPFAEASYDEHQADRALHAMFQRFADEHAMEPHRRKLVLPGAPEIDAVRDLVEHAPHMAGIVQAFADTLALHHKASQPFRMAPTIIVGPPGVGKTWLLQAICNTIGLPFLPLPMTIMTAAFAWTGSHRTWRSATPGIVAKQLIENPVANPVIFVDEFDKASSRNDDHNVYNAFYTLLEQSTAAQFVDEYLMAPMDASHISWLFTANDLSAIPVAILDRLNVVHVKAPALDHRRRVLTSIYLELNAKFASLFDAAPTTTLLAALNAGTLRTARRDLEAAMARAAGAGRSTVMPIDLPNARKPGSIGLV